MLICRMTPSRKELYLQVLFHSLADDAQLMVRPLHVLERRGYDVPIVPAQVVRQHRDFIVFSQLYTLQQNY